MQRVALCGIKVGRKQMALTFNMLLCDGGLDPREVRIMRHQHLAKDGLTPFALWRDNCKEFERYQSAQRGGVGFRP